MKQRKRLLSLLCALILALAFSVPAALAENTAAFAGGSGTLEDPWQVATPAQLDAIRNDLTASYILTEDIDLANFGVFTPIGAYVQDKSENPDGEEPILEYAFTGTFEGGGHVISHLTIEQPESMGVGMFACIAGEKAFARNVTFRDVNVSGAMLSATLVGYLTSGAENAVDDVHLTSSAGQRNSVASSFVMAGGIVGGSTLSSITNCSVENTDVAVGPYGIGGALGGGLSRPIFNNCSAKNCTVRAEMLMTAEVDGTLTEGVYVGGLAGCVNSARKPVENCTAESVEIIAGGAGRLIGGLIGGGGSELTGEAPEAMKVVNCAANNVSITILGADVSGVGGLIGGGMTDEDSGVVHSYDVSNCAASGTITAADADVAKAEIGSLLGRAYRCTLAETVASDVTLNGEKIALIGVEMK